MLGRLRDVELRGAGARGNACKERRAGQSEVRLTTGAPGARRTLSMLLLRVFGGLRLLASIDSEFYSRNVRVHSSIEVTADVNVGTFRSSDRNNFEV